MKFGETKAPLSVVRLTNLLMERVKHLKLFRDTFYFYDIERAIYQSRTELQVLIGCVIENLSCEHYSSFNFINKVINQLKASSNSYMGSPKIDKRFIVFTNGVLDLHTRELLSYSPEYFVVSRLPFDYD